MERENVHKRLSNLGFTLVEALVAMSVVTILLGVGVPSFFNLMEEKRLSHATEAVYNDLKLAYSQSIRQKKNLFVSFSPGSNWCYGLSDTTACDCHSAENCQVESNTVVSSGSDFFGTSLAITGFGGGLSPSLMFEGIRGTTNASGEIALTRGSLSTKVSINRLGNIVICSNHLKGYQLCS